MARQCLFTALLDPEDAFQDIVGIVGTTFGIIHIDLHKLKFAFEVEDKDASWTEMSREVYGVVKAFLSTLAWVTRIGVGFKPFDCVDCVDGQLRTVTVGFAEQPQPKVDKSALPPTRELLQLVMSDSTLRWALEDYRTALRERGHELIFLHRCIEWLQIRFDGESNLTTKLRITKSQLRKITAPANNYYLARHALQVGPQPVPPQVLEDAFKSTRTILQKYMDYLRCEAANGT